MSEYWKDVKPWLKEESAKRREENKNNSASILTASGVSFESKNDGVHLIVKHNSTVVDFWPSTGKWIVRKGKSGRGVFQLLKHLGI